jgi:hypothetical protein
MGEINFSQEDVKSVTEDAEKYAAARRLAERAIEVQAKLDSAKPLYDELDQIAMQLKDMLGTGTSKALFVAEKAVTVVDNFAESNVMFRPSACRRFELKVEDMEKFVKRLKKEAK